MSWQIGGFDDRTRTGSMRLASGGPPDVEQNGVRLLTTARTGANVDREWQLSADFPTMKAEITTQKIGTKWHGYIDGRPDIEETALTEEAVRRKMEQLRDRIGACGAQTKLFGGRTCELIAGHREIGQPRTVHRSGSIEWFDLPPEDTRPRKKLRRVA